MNKPDILNGKIVKTLVKLALPIMGTSFLQMAYNMTDMIWIGRVGSDAVAAVGSAGFYIWLSFALVTVSKIGAEVFVAQSIGRDNFSDANIYARSAIQLNLFLAILYSSIMIIFKNNLIDFFNIKNPLVNSMATSYLTIISIGFVFSFSTQVFTAIFNGSGDSKTPFIINTIGLIMNTILDPLLIFGIGFLPKLGVNGAAIATVLSQIIVNSIFLVIQNKRKYSFNKINFFISPNFLYIKNIIKLGLPAAFQSFMFTLFSMFLARIIANWGPLPIAVQKVGSQIESISWMIASGFSVAISTFVGQNYGANNISRIKQGFFSSFRISFVMGILNTFLLIFFAKPIFSIFIPEEEAIYLGIDYLKILGISQLFMCVEITTAGAFNGLGKTLPPSIIGILFNALRIPMALILSKENILGLNGIWWSITISSVLKGIILFLWFNIFIKGDNLEKTKIRA